MHNHSTLLQNCHDAFWSFPEDTLSSNRRIAAVFQAIADSPTADFRTLSQIANKVLLADGAMCEGGECPIREHCWRYVAPSQRWKTYLEAPPFNEEGCDYFWDVNEQ